MLRNSAKADNCLPFTTVCENGVEPDPGKKREMMIETQSTHVTPIGGNVFVDLGFAPEEAAAFQAESQRIIDEKLASMGYLVADLKRATEVKQPG